MSKRMIVAMIVLAIGCGGSATGPTGSGGGGGGGGSGGSGGVADSGGVPTAPGDMAVPSSPSDMAPASSFVCGTMTCGAGTSCCVVGTTPTCASSCPDAGFVASCASPGDCQNSACCVKVSAALSITEVSCTPYAQCVPSLSSTGGFDRACNTSADCTNDGKGGNNGTTLPDCCTYTPVGRKGCFSKALSFLGWNCP